MTSTVPLEIKSGKDYKKHRALDKLMDIEEYQLNKAVVLSSGNLEQDAKVIYIPIYLAGLICHRKMKDITINLDIFKDL